MKRALAVLAVFLCLAVPSPAHAVENDYVGSFVDGIETWNVQEKVEHNEDSDVPVETVRLGETQEGEETSTVSQVNGWLSSIRVNYNDTNYAPDNWFRVIRAIIRDVFIPVAVLLVFIWWGVRKALRVIMASFRKGRMSV